MATHALNLALTHACHAEMQILLVSRVLRGWPSCRRSMRGMKLFAITNVTRRLTVSSLLLSAAARQQSAAALMVSRNALCNRSDAIW